MADAPSAFRPKTESPALAAAMILVATAFIAGTTLIAKALGTGVLGPALHPFQISFGRFLFAFLAFSTAMALLRPRFTSVHPGLHLGRTAFGWGGITLLFAAVAHIPLADATAISFLNPVFAMVLAIPLLGERVGRVRWSAAIIALVGALILLRPTPDAFQPAALLALAAAAIMGMELIFMKKLVRREGPFQILFINNAIGLGIAGMAALTIWQPLVPLQWMALAALGLLMACAQAFFINAMARADASFVAPFSYATLVFAAAYDFAGFGTAPDAVTVLGAGVILAGAGLLAWREGRLRASADTPSGTGPRPER